MQHEDCISSGSSPFTKIKMTFRYRNTCDPLKCLLGSPILTVLICMGKSIRIYSGYYMSAHLLLNLLKELEKRDKMQGLSSILSLFHNEFNKFNNTRAGVLDDIKITLKSHFSRKNIIILSLCTQRCYGRHKVSRKSISILLHGVISLPDSTS